MQKSTASPMGEELFFQVEFFFTEESSPPGDKKGTLQSRQHGAPETVN